MNKSEIKKELKQLYGEHRSHTIAANDIEHQIERLEGYFEMGELTQEEYKLFKEEGGAANVMLIPKFVAENTGKSIKETETILKSMCQKGFLKEDTEEDMTWYQTVYKNAPEGFPWYDEEVIFCDRHSSATPKGTAERQQEASQKN